MWQRRGARRKGRTSSVSREAAATFPNGGRILENGVSVLLSSRWADLD